jgi:hypothetical protein
VNVHQQRSLASLANNKVLVCRQCVLQKSLSCKNEVCIGTAQVSELECLKLKWSGGTMPSKLCRICTSLRHDDCSVCRKRFWIVPEKAVPSPSPDRIYMNRGQLICGQCIDVCHKCQTIIRCRPCNVCGHKTCSRCIKDCCSVPRTDDVLALLSKINATTHEEQRYEPKSPVYEPGSPSYYDPASPSYRQEEEYNPSMVASTEIYDPFDPTM